MSAPPGPAGLASDLRSLWGAYTGAGLADRCFVLVRRAVCPWGAVVGALPAAGRLLDVGCGRGVLAALVRRHRPGLAYVGVDVSERALRAARLGPGGAGAEFHLLEDGLWSRLGDFDCVVLVDVLYAVGIERWPALLARCAERLRPGGRLVLKETVPTPAWKRAVVGAQETLAIRVLGYTRGEAPHFETEDAYREALRRSGLDPVSSGRVDAWRPWPHHLFVAARRAADPGARA